MAIPIKTRQQIADEYSSDQSKVTVKVLNNHIEKHHLNILEGCNLFPKQQKEIYETLGYPLSVNRHDYKDV